MKYILKFDFIFNRILFRVLNIYCVIVFFGKGNSGFFFFSIYVIIILYYFVIFFLGNVVIGRNLYILCVLGNDSWLCDELMFCKIIWWVVMLVLCDDSIYLDGMNIENDLNVC